LEAAEAIFPEGCVVDFDVAFDVDNLQGGGGGMEVASFAAFAASLDFKVLATVITSVVYNV